MPSDTESESDLSAPELLEDDENRLSEDEEFPISEDEDEDEDEEEVEEAGGMKGWAGSMAKVLKSEKSSVLSKAKKVEDVAKKKEKKSYAFEIDGEEEGKSEDNKPDQTSLERALEKRKYRERREVSFSCNCTIFNLFQCNTFFRINFEYSACV